MYLLKSSIFARISLLTLVPLIASSAIANEIGIKWGANLVANSSFEQGNDFWNTPEGAGEVVEGVAHTGQRSFYYNNANPDAQQLFFQRLEVRPGQHLRLGLWVKGENVIDHKNTLDKYPSPGVNIYVESYDAQGQLIQKFQWRRIPGSVLKTYDWTRVEGEYRVPEKATRLSVGFSLRPGMTGSIWVDDVEIRAKQQVPVVSFLQFPNYRGLVKQGDTTPWKFSMRFEPMPEWKKSGLKLKTSLKNIQKELVFSNVQEITLPADQYTLAVKPPKTLPLGKYTLTQTVIGPEGYQVFTADHEITVVKDMPKVYIDAQGFTVVDGKRFFPLGLFLNTAGEEELKDVSQGGFNTILSYHYGNYGSEPEQFLERANRHHLKVLYSLKDMYPDMHNAKFKDFETAFKTVKKLRAHPALLSWYINDELGTAWLPQLQTMYDQVAKLDPQHPALQLSDRPQLMERFFSVGDIHGTNPYPVHAPYELIGPELTSTGIFTRLTMEATHGAKGVWLVPQIMDWAVYPAGATGHKSHQPTLDEMRYQAYASLIGGAKALILYSYFDLWFADYKRVPDRKLFEQRWPDVVALAKETNSIIPMLLEDKKIELSLSDNPQMYAGAWEYQNKLHVLYANPYYRNNSITFKMPVGWKIGESQQGQVKSSLANGSVTLEIPAIGSGVFNLVRE